MTQKSLIQSIKSFTENQQLVEDSTWQHIFESDIKSIFPKYQITKIERTKIKLDRCRLMMDHLQDFLFLEKHKKESEKIDTAKLASEIESLAAAQEEKSHEIAMSQELEIIKKKDLSDKIVSDLTEYGNDLIHNRKAKNLPLDEFVQNDPNWSKYFATYCQHLQSTRESSIDQQRYHLSKTVPPSTHYEALNCSLSSQILYQRHKQKVIGEKLVEISDQKQDITESIPTYLKQDWQASLEAMKK